MPQVLVVLPTPSLMADVMAVGLAHLGHAIRPPRRLDLIADLLAEAGCLPHQTIIPGAAIDLAPWQPCLLIIRVPVPTPALAYPIMIATWDAATQSLAPCTPHPPASRDGARAADRPSDQKKLSPHHLRPVRVGRRTARTGTLIGVRCAQSALSTEQSL